VPLAIVSHHTLPWLPLKRCARGPADSQARSLIVTGPEELRAGFARHTGAQLVAGLTAMRPRPGDVPGYATRVALAGLGRARFVDAQITGLEELIIPLVAARAPGLLALHGAGPGHRRAAAAADRLAAAIPGAQRHFLAGHGRFSLVITQAASYLEPFRAAA
jgi:hypothetical protein